MSRAPRLPRIEKSEFKGRVSYLAICEECNWSVVRKDKELAKMALKRHVSTRVHKTNAAAPYRFIV